MLLGSFAFSDKRLSISYVIRDGGRGFPDLLQYYIGGSPQFITILHGGLLKAYDNIIDLVGIWKGLYHIQY